MKLTKRVIGTCEADVVGLIEDLVSSCVFFSVSYTRVTQQIYLFQFIIIVNVKEN